jgi:hypothetical protein
MVLPAPKSSMLMRTAGVRTPPSGCDLSSGSSLTAVSVTQDQLAGDAAVAEHLPEPIEEAAIQQVRAEVLTARFTVMSSSRRQLGESSYGNVPW